MQAIQPWQAMAEAAEGMRATASTETRMFSPPMTHPPKNHTEKCVEITTYVTDLFLQVQNVLIPTVKATERFLH
jgi:hypothetical protein